MKLVSSIFALLSVFPEKNVQSEFIVTSFLLGYTISNLASAKLVENSAIANVISKRIIIMKV